MTTHRIEKVYWTLRNYCWRKHDTFNMIPPEFKELDTDFDSFADLAVFIMINYSALAMNVLQKDDLYVRFTYNDVDGTEVLCPIEMLNFYRLVHPHLKDEVNLVDDKRKHRRGMTTREAIATYKLQKRVRTLKNYTPSVDEYIEFMRSKDWFEVSKITFAVKVETNETVRHVEYIDNILDRVQEHFRKEL